MKFAIAATMALFLVGCGASSDSVREQYIGVKSNLSCKEQYKLPVNITICKNKSSSH